MISQYITSFVDVINNFPIIISLLMIVIGGDIVVITLAFLSQQGIVNLYYVIIFGFIGAVVSDFLWYFLTKTKLIDMFKEWKYIKQHYSYLEKRVEKSSHGKDFLILLTAKFVAGTRAVTIIYLSLKKINLLKFSVLSIVSNLIWVSFLIAVGVLAGRGFATLVIFQNIQLALISVVGVIAIWYVIEKIITKEVVSGS